MELTETYFVKDYNQLTACMACYFALYYIIVRLIIKFTQIKKEMKIKKLRYLKNIT